MQTYNRDKIDIAVIGAGHAGIEAALAAARMGLETVLFTINLDAVGNMPCNPSIGGTGKGHLVYEIDALGGEMGRAADKVTLQSRTLNLGKGAAVHSKRVQADRALYRRVMKQTLEHTPHLRLVQSEITDIETTNDGNGKRISAVVTAFGARYECGAAIISTGTFLRGRVIVGETEYSSGPDGMLPATQLTESLRREGVALMRFKTGTPARVHRASIDFSRLEIQPGEDCAEPFSADTDPSEYSRRPSLPCYIVYTNSRTHDIIRQNLSRSPLYSGRIEGIGPRYCPSIEDKVMRFADKERHQLFVEPMGIDTEEMYIQGFSSSLPEEVQVEMLHSLDGFEHAQIMRTAYAIEYDCVDPTQLLPTLEFKAISGLYGAGQFNGSSGYEEAAAQGLVAGINAALKLQSREPMVLTRQSSYIGTLIDDLVTKGTNEPYRIMTSRSEYRLLLRQDNAASRLTPIGRRVGLINDSRWECFVAEEDATAAEIKRIESTSIAPSETLAELLNANNSTAVNTGIKLAELLRRPELDYDKLAPVDSSRPELSRRVIHRAETEIKYAGYIKRQILNYNIMEKLIIAGKEFNSRLFLGTGKFNSNELMEQAILASETEMVTVAMKRIELGDKEDDMLKHIQHPNIQLLPNTSGVRDAEEAVFAAQMAREAFGTNWLKLEIHPDPRYLLPDSVETLKATEKLVKMGFVVLPYCQADPTLCRQLEEAGAATVMPLAAPIGTNKGLQTKDFIRIIIEQANVPVVVDAGIGAPSHAAEAMEMGASACLVNTAIAVAGNPVEMAKAFKEAVIAGRRAYEAGLGSVGHTFEASASSPLTAFLNK